LGGRTEADTYELVRHLDELGVDAIHISNGMYASPALRQIIAPMYTEHAFNMDVAEQVKKLVSCPVIVTNRINDPKMADTILKMGKADFIGMGRGSLADPHLPEKAKAGKFSNIRYCIGCLQGCEAGLLNDDCATCLVNPRVGREYENPMDKVSDPKKVMVIGAGPGGLTAAETAALVGHKVTVFEAKNEIGGQFRSAAYPLGKGELATLPASLRKSLADLGVEIRLNTEVTEELIKSEAPDAIIIATGAKPLVLPIEGIDGDNVVMAEDVLLGNVDVQPGPVVVCGGGEVGGETAHYLTQTCQDITLIEMQNDILNDMMPITRSCLVQYIAECGIKVLTGAKVSKITKDGVSYTDSEGNTKTVPAATVVSAFGYKSYNPLEEAARKLCDNVQVIGGAVKAGNALVAIKEGYDAALAL
jgi:NADPH-dependent 2,4-dienoyl-CoA reductase/sulfur reductase-like enzyme